MRRVITAKQPLARGQLVQNDAQRKHVTAPIDLAGARLLRRHVAKFAFDSVASLELGVGGRVGHAEIDQLGLTVEANQNVVR